MTGYVVHYRYGATNMTQSVPPSSTHVEIDNLTECYNYTFSVELPQSISLECQTIQNLN